ncbi:hypothetical protein AB0J47_02690 [Nocardia sp. NPDC049737]|uniref:hypothetical protein n=1 Tax=Nocardia sp. NPDC049737 TaxID=3154358 RepID=UPI003446AEB3
MNERHSDFDDVYPAMGRLVVNSSFLESRVRMLVAWLARVDAAGIVFDGQSVDWLVRTGKAMLRECQNAENFALQDVKRFENALSQAKALNQERNFFVHGDWSTRCYDDECERRPSGKPADHRIFYVARSRLQRASEVREVAVVDVELLADQVRTLGQEIDAALGEGDRLRWAWEAMYPEPPLKRSWDDETVVLEALRRLEQSGDAHP